MFLVNGEPLTKNSYPDHHKWLEERKREIRSEKKRAYNFSGFIRKSKVQDENGRMIDADQLRMVSVRSMFTDPDNGLESYDEWSYIPSLSACRVKDGVYTPIHLTRTLSYNTVFDVERDIDMIVFFKYITKNKNVREVDLAKINKEKAEKQALESQAHWYIYNPQSPIHPDKAGTEDIIRNIAMSWQVSGANEKDVYTVMHELWERVKVEDALKESGRGFDTFCKDVGNRSNSDKRATVIIAIKRGILDYHENQWSLKQKGGGLALVCGVPLGQEAYKEERVINYVVNDEYYYQEVLMAIEGASPVQTGLKSKLSREELYAEVIKLNKGWEKGRLTQISNAVLNEIIEKKLTPDDL